MGVPLLVPPNEAVEKPPRGGFRYLVHACSFFSVFRKSCVVAVCEPLHEEIVVKLVGEVGNWKIVAHIAFKFYSVASGTFSTGSTQSSAGAPGDRSER
jgi:hypothetical protein